MVAVEDFIGPLMCAEVGTNTMGLVQKAHSTPPHRSSPRAPPHAPRTSRELAATATARPEARPDHSGAATPVCAPANPWSGGPARHTLAPAPPFSTARRSAYRSASRTIARSRDSAVIASPATRLASATSCRSAASSALYTVLVVAARAAVPQPRLATARSLLPAAQAPASQPHWSVPPKL